MGAYLHLIPVSDGVPVRLAILVQSPDVLALLFTAVPSGLLDTGWVDSTGGGHYRVEYGRDQSLTALWQEIHERWPEAKIYRLETLGADTPQRWELG